MGMKRRTAPGILAEAEKHGGVIPTYAPDRTPTPHYMRGGLECIDAMRAIASPEAFAEHCRLTAFKYLWRMGEKDSAAKELAKAEDYVRWARERLEGDQ